MFNDKDLELLDFAVRFVIANIDNELLDIMRESLKMPPEVSEAELERIRHDLANRRAELKVVEEVLDKAAAASTATWPNWDVDTAALIEQAKRDAVEDLNYELAAHWRDVGHNFKISMLTRDKWFQLLQDMQKYIPAGTKLGKAVRAMVASKDLVDAIKKEHGYDDGR